MALAPLVDSRLRRGLSDDLESVLGAARLRLGEASAALRKITSDAADVKTRKDRALKAVATLQADIDVTLNLNPAVVAWVEQPGREPRLWVAPLDVAPVLNEFVWEHRTAVLTTATIPPGLAQIVGLADDAVDELDAGSPFDFATDGLLYCAAHLPDPRQPGLRGGDARGAPGPHHRRRRAHPGPLHQLPGHAGRGRCSAGTCWTRRSWSRATCPSRR